MSQLTIVIDFEGTEEAEEYGGSMAKRLLQNLSQNISDLIDNGMDIEKRLLDINGNSVGQYTLTGFQKKG